MKAEPRIAFFTDSYLEVNGVAQTSRQLAAFAQRRGSPFLCVHAGPRTEAIEEGSLRRLTLRRTRAGFRLDADLRFDLLLWRHARLALETVRRFQPDVIHITGPSDVGLLGAFLAWRLGIPILLSWHTNVHEYARTRLERLFDSLSLGLPKTVGRRVEQISLDIVAQFYRLGRVLLAPNEELAELVASHCRRPTFLMRRGVETVLFTPEKRDRSDNLLNLGYVGRLSPEKNIRFLATLEKRLMDAGCRDFKFTIVGTGSELPWLQAEMRTAEFTGVLKGEALARAYANFDLFVFPSETDTFGNVVLEAQASGVPAIVGSGGGPKFIVQDRQTGFVARQESDFTEIVCELRRNPEKLRQMSEAARRHAANLTWDRIFEEVYQAYRHCLERDRMPSLANTIRPRWEADPEQS